LEGRVAVVAGASRRIGMGIAVELAAAGAHVYALGRTLHPGTGEAEGSLSETVALMETLGGRGEAVVCDCMDEGAIAEVMAKVKAQHGRLDVLVNSVFSAARFGASVNKRFWEIPTSVWRDVVDLGARSAYLASWHAAPLLMETAKREGRPTLIVNVTGRGAVRYRYNVVYGVGKAATERLTRDMALDLKAHHVAAVSIWPNGHAVDPSKPETPRYNGRAVAALADDPAVLEKSGQYFWSAALGEEYGFTDEFGHRHPIGDLTDAFSLDHAEG
jgi:NAD(P)-dependent dehydrogenase (short-subunit alcohol dehydrogenase family)